MRILITCLVISISICQLAAQGVHFSQMSNYPLFLSPALAGAVEEDLVNRFIIGHREQGRAIDQANPLKTYYLSYDRRFCLREGHFFGLGVGVLKDELGMPGLTNHQLALSGAFHFNLNRHKKRFLSVGFQVDGNQYRLKEEGLIFESQYEDGIFFTDKPSGEVFSNNFTRNFVDLAAGVQFNNYPKTTGSHQSELGLKAGIGFYHLLKQPLAFLAPTIEEEEQLPPRLTLNASLFGKIWGDHQLQVQGFFNSRATSGIYQHWEFVVGNQFRFSLKNSYFKSLLFGIHTRITGQLQEKILFDALILNTGLRFGNVDLHVAYDITTSSKSMADNRQGGFELGISWAFGTQDYCPNCPKF